MNPVEKIFEIRSEKEFNHLAQEIFKVQLKGNKVYRDFITVLGTAPDAVRKVHQIPFLPIRFFKSHKVMTGPDTEEKIFISSGTTGMERSRHFVADINLYQKCLEEGFRFFFGSFDNFEIFALTPEPEKNPGSSLVFMVNEWIRLSGSDYSGFYLEDQERLAKLLSADLPGGRKKLLIGITWALLDFAERFSPDPGNVVVMETGGMKGRRKEMVREELHERLRKGFHVENICSEYGMTELLSQAYSDGNGIFRTPPWMKVLIRDPDDPLSLLPPGQAGGVNIIDLANLHSVSFIATQDLGKLNPDGSFEILGRFDDSDVRGCSLLV